MTTLLMPASQALLLGFPFPDCALCKKPVDEVKAWDDQDKDVRHFVFMCHGSKEHVSLDSEFVEAWLHGGGKLGEVFNGTSLPHPQMRLESGG